MVEGEEGLSARECIEALALFLEGKERARELLRRLEDELRKLQESGGELNRRNRDLEEFARLVVHDIKSGLSAIEGFCRLAQEACRQDNQEMVLECVAQALTACHRLEDLVENLYRAGKAGFEGDESVEVDLDLVAREVYGDLLAAHGKSVELEVSDLPRVWCEPFKIRLVMGNLLGNAFRFRDEGKERCWVRVSATQEGGWVIVRVENNGIGFPKEHAGSLFKPFFRLHEERSGYGLGLLSVRRAVESWGGRVWAEGRPGQGSTFYFTVPTRERTS